MSEYHALRFDRPPSYNTPPREAAMSFSIRLFRRFPVQCIVSYSVGPFSGISLAGCRKTRQHRSCFWPQES